MIEELLFQIIREKRQVWRIKKTPWENNYVEIGVELYIGVQRYCRGGAAKNVGE